jgi:hypothetical protein
MAPRGVVRGLVDQPGAMSVYQIPQSRGADKRAFSADIRRSMVLSWTSSALTRRCVRRGRREIADFERSTRPAASRRPDRPGIADAGLYLALPMPPRVRVRVRNGCRGELVAAGRIDALLRWCCRLGWWRRRRCCRRGCGGRRCRRCGGRGRAGRGVVACAAAARGQRTQQNDRERAGDTGQPTSRTT